MENSKTYAKVMQSPKFIQYKKSLFVHIPLFIMTKMIHIGFFWIVHQTKSKTNNKKKEKSMYSNNNTQTQTTLWLITLTQFVFI